MRLLLQSERLRGAILFILSSALYWKAAAFGFQYSWDDGAYVVDNPYIREISWDNLKSIFTTPFVSGYFPVHILSYLVDYALGGTNPLPYHLLNIFLHGGNAVLAYAVLRKLSNNSGLAFWVALVFAVHPLNVEAVAWVSQRKTLLSACFAFGAILSYLRWRESGTRLYYRVAVVMFILSVFSKTMTVLLPLALAYHERLYRPAEERRFAPLLPFFIISILGGWTTAATSMKGEAILPSTLNTDLLFGTIYPTMLPVYWKYTGLLLWPSNLSAFYDTTIYQSFLTAEVMVSLLALAGILVLVFFKGDRSIRFWCLWAVVTFLPSANILPIQVFYADRFMYLPQLGFFMGIGLLLGRIAAHLPASLNSYLQRSFLASASFMIIVFAVMSYQRMDVWRDDTALWQDTVAKSPDLATPRQNLGVAYEKAGRLKEAEKEYLAALALSPDQKIERNLAMVRLKLRLLEDGQAATSRTTR